MVSIVNNKLNKYTMEDNIKQVVKDVKFLIASKESDETVEARMLNFIEERDEAINYTRCCTEFYCYNKKIDSKKCKNQCMGCEYYEESKSR
jgi:hypothetical protein